jgi:DNA-binding NarL/FixJ family response regulator
MEQLTARELEVLRCLSNGWTEKQVAERLYLSPETVKTHQRTILRKLEARNRTHAVACALRKGLIS